VRSLARSAGRPEQQDEQRQRCRGDEAEMRSAARNERRREGEEQAHEPCREPVAGEVPRQQVHRVRGQHDLEEVDQVEGRDDADERHTEHAGERRVVVLRQVHTGPEREDVRREERELAVL
jgi:hypothetical protein